MPFLIKSFIFPILVSLWGPAAFCAPPETTPLTPLAAKEVAKKAESAKVTIVNLWATWCAPCKEEMPELVSYFKSQSKNGVQLILVSGDNESEWKEASQFLTKVGVDFPSYRLAEAPDEFMKGLAEPNWPGIVPTTMIYDSKAKRIRYWAKRVPMKELKSIVKKAIRSGKVATPAKMGSH